MSLLNPNWKYTHSTMTNISETLRKHGFKPTTDAERDARQRIRYPDAAAAVFVSDLVERIRKKA